jgi:hypothetical protein
MSKLYALLVGIDRYADPGIRELHGCKNDVEDAVTMLRSRADSGTEVVPLLLRDGEATRVAVIDGLRTHLGRATAEDTALFWFSGHGSEAKAPEWAWFEEPTGWLQTLVCADSRTPGVPELWDKELSVLLDGVAARARHVTVVLDSCHSEGATREADPARWLPPAPPRDRNSLPRLADSGSGPEHVVLSACRRDERAVEQCRDGRWNGLFTWSLLEAMRRLGAGATYRQLAVAAQAEVAQRRGTQVPQLYSAASALIDQPFLGGDLRRPDAPVVMTFGTDGWQIDAGRAHGLPAGPGIRVGVPGVTPVREAVVTRVLTERSLVEPVGGWRPAADEQFRVVLTAVPGAATAVRFDGDDVAGLVRAATGPYVRAAGPDDTPDLDVRLRHGQVRIAEHDGAEITTTDPGRAPTVLAHLARWRRIRDLRHPMSGLAGAVRIEIVPASPGLSRAPERGRALTPDSTGVYRLEYRREGHTWAPPEVFIRLRNRSDRELYCVLLDLTGDHGVNADLFPGAPIAAGKRGAALRGRRIRASLPDGVPAPGRSSTDWLVVVAAEQRFSADPFLLPPLGQAPDRPGHREAGPDVLRTLTAADSLSDWTTAVARLVIEVPCAG